MYSIRNTFVGWIVVNNDTGLLHSAWGKDRRTADQVKRDLNPHRRKLKPKKATKLTLLTTR